MLDQEYQSLKWSRIVRESNGCKEEIGRDAENREGEKNKNGREKEKARSARGKEEAMGTRKKEKKTKMTEKKKRNMDTQKRPQRTARLQLLRSRRKSCQGWMDT